MARPRHGKVVRADAARLARAPHRLGRAVHEREPEQAGPALTRRLVEAQHLLEQVVVSYRPRIDEDGAIADAELRADTLPARRIEGEMIDVDAGGDDAPRRHHRPTPEPVE